MVLGQGILLMLSGGTLYYGFAVFMKYILDEYSWSLASASLVYGFMALEGGVTSPVYGWLVHRFGVRKPMMAGAILAVAGFFILYRLDSLFDFTVGFILVGLGFGVYWIAPIQAITNWFSAKRSTATGLAMLGGGLGGLMAPVILWVCKLYGWRFAMGASAIVVAVAYIPLSLLFRTSPEPYGYEVDGVPGVKGDVERTSPARLDVRTPRVWEVVRTWRFWKIVAVFTTSYLPVSAIMPHMLIYLGQKNISAELAAVTISSLTVCSMAGRFLGGWIGDRVDRRLVFNFPELAPGHICCLVRSCLWWIVGGPTPFGRGYLWRCFLRDHVRNGDSSCVFNLVCGTGLVRLGF